MALSNKERQQRWRSKARAAIAAVASLDGALPAPPAPVPEVDLASFDTLRVYAEIASDPRQPGLARVAAGKAYDAAKRRDRDPESTLENRVAARAIELGARGRIN
jgi:hypothetical protein